MSQADSSIVSVCWVLLLSIGQSKERLDMVSCGGFDAKAGRRRLYGAADTPDAIVKLAHADPVKALVMEYISQLVADGSAEWQMLANGEIELQCDSGETFILTDSAIVRVS